MSLFSFANPSGGLFQAKIGFFQTNKEDVKTDELKMEKTRETSINSGFPAAAPSSNPHGGLFQLSSNIFMQNKTEEMNKQESLESPMIFGPTNPFGGFATSQSNTPIPKVKETKPPLSPIFGPQQRENIEGSIPLDNQPGGLFVSSSKPFNSQHSDNSRSIFNTKPAESTGQTIHAPLLDKNIPGSKALFSLEHFVVNPEAKNELAGSAAQFSNPFTSIAGHSPLLPGQGSLLNFGKTQAEESKQKSNDNPLGKGEAASKFALFSSTPSTERPLFDPSVPLMSLGSSYPKAPQPSISSNPKPLDSITEFNFRASFEKQSLINEVPTNSLDFASLQSFESVTGLNPFDLAVEVKEKYSNELMQNDSETHAAFIEKLRSTEITMKEKEQNLKQKIQDLNRSLENCKVLSKGNQLNIEKWNTEKKKLEDMVTLENNEIERINKTINILEEDEKKNRPVYGPSERKRIDYDKVPNYLEQKLKLLVMKREEEKQKCREKENQLTHKFQSKIAHYLNKAEKFAVSLKMKEEKCNLHKKYIAFQKMIGSSTKEDYSADLSDEQNSFIHQGQSVRPRVIHEGRLGNFHEGKKLWVNTDIFLLVIAFVLTVLFLKLTN